MAQSNKSGNTDSRTSKFDDMSDADLVAFIGGDVNPNTSHDDLIVMAIEVDDARSGRT